MLIHFLKVILRYLGRKVFFTSLNVVGLSIGLASCIVIYLFVVNELSYDRFHTDGKEIYRVIRQSQINGMPYDIGVTAAPYAGALKQDFPHEIRSATRAFPFSSLLTYEDKSFIEERLLLADSNFFNFFSFPLYSGDGASVLKTGNGLVLSRALARRYFGEEDPIGKIMRLDNEHDMVVTGVMDDLPGNSHLQFDAVGTINIIESEPWFNDWWGNAFSTYVTVGNEEQAAYLNSAFPAFMEKYFGKDFERVGNRIALKLEPLHDIYFNHATRYEQNIVHGDRRYVFIFASIGILLLLLAGINYVNLATAQASYRAKEVGIRKALGSSQASVACQFLTESFFLSLFSMLLAVGLAQVAIPFLNAQFDLSIPGVFSDPWLGLFIALLLILITFASGAYPSFLLSSFRPVKVLKGEVKGNLRYVFVRKALVIFQFGASGFMIISTLFISEQLHYMREKDLGFESGHLLVLRLNNGLRPAERHSFAQSVLQNNEFTNASLASGYPGGFYDATTVDIQGSEGRMRMRTLWTDDDYATTMGLTMLAGRFFSPDFPSDSSSSVVLNETAIRQLGWTTEEALGKQVRLAQFDTLYRRVVGVIEDFHFTSVKEQIEPLIISYAKTRPNLLLRLSGSDLSGAVAKLEKLWSYYDTGFPLNFVFLDDVIGRLYHAEVVQGRVFTLFSVISVIIACLGILGLATYMAAQRRKEIGVRKVLGATASQVSALLMKDLLTLVFMANLVAIPAGYWAMKSWLEGFPYRVGLNPLIFVTGSLLVLAIAALIVGINASRTAKENPVNALRAE